MNRATPNSRATVSCELVRAKRPHMTPRLPQRQASGTGRFASPETVAWLVFRQSTLRHAPSRCSRDAHRSQPMFLVSLFQCDAIAIFGPVPHMSAKDRQTQQPGNGHEERFQYGLLGTEHWDQ